MAIDTLRPQPVPNKPYPHEQNPLEYSPEDVPNVYASICKGDCLSPIFEDGACLVFSKEQRPEPGDFVGFWLHPDAIAPGEHPRRVKRLVMGLPNHLSLPYSVQPGDEVEPVIIVEQLNPPKTYQVRASRMLAMHRVVGEAEADGTGQARMVRQMVGGQMMRYHPEETAGA